MNYELSDYHIWYKIVELVACQITNIINCNFLLRVRNF